jgi:hypothetical protein
MNRGHSRIAAAGPWPLFALLLYVALWILCPQTFIASDPWVYSSRAFAISQHFDLGNSHVFNHRLAVTLPVAFLYMIFGVSMITTHLWPLCAALLVGLTVWLALPDRRSKIIGVALCMTSVSLFKSSTALYPDIIATAFMALSSLILFNRRRLIGRHGAYLLVPSTAVCLLFLAFLAKESAYWMLPLWALAFLADARRNDRTMLFRRFYLPALVTGILLGLGYLVFCSMMWEDPLARLKSIQSLTGHHVWSWERAPAGALTRRLTIAPVRLFVREYGAPVLLLALLAFVVAPQSLRPWGHYTLFCLLFFWFGSTSLSRYEPMPMDGRMTLPMLPGLLILAAYVASRLSVRSERQGWVNSSIPVLFILGIVVVPFVQHVHSQGGQGSAEANAMAIIQREVGIHPEREHLLVCSDARSPESLAFHFGYRYPVNLRVLSVGTLTEAMLDSADVRFLFIHEQRSAFLRSVYREPHYDREICSLGLAPVYAAGSVRLFRTERGQEVSRLIPPGNRMKGSEE